MGDDDLNDRDDDRDLDIVLLIIGVAAVMMWGYLLAEAYLP